jgi:hypothetical protein
MTILLAVLLTVLSTTLLSVLLTVLLTVLCAHLLKELLTDNFQLQYKLENYRRFKISIPIFSFLRSITILPMGVLVPFQIIIKDKPFLEKAKAFYAGMEK